MEYKADFQGVTLAMRNAGGRIRGTSAVVTSEVLLLLCAALIEGEPLPRGEVLAGDFEVRRERGGWSVGFFAEKPRGEEVKPPQLLLAEAQLSLEESLVLASELDAARQRAVEESESRYEELEAVRAQLREAKGKVRAEKARADAAEALAKDAAVRSVVE